MVISVQNCASDPSEAFLFLRRLLPQNQRLEDFFPGAIPALTAKSFRMRSSEYP
jgi:hypothetical protein